MTLPRLLQEAREGYMARPDLTHLDLDFVAPVGCKKCPRLYDFISSHKAKYPDWHNGAVPSFGSIDAEILIVGLAPGLRGANATGRPFTGDFAGDTLYQALSRHGFASGSFDRHAHDTLALHNVRITNAVKCVPPQNKPTGAEINTCRDHFLIPEIQRMKHLKMILALGGIAHKALIKTFNLQQSAYPFGHLACHDTGMQSGRQLMIIDSYHCSRYNVNTNRLTVEMFDKVITYLRDNAS